MSKLNTRKNIIISAVLFFCVIVLTVYGWSKYRINAAWNEVYELHVYRKGNSPRGDSIVLTDIHGRCSVNERVAVFNGALACWDIIESYSYYDWNDGNPIFMGKRNRVDYRGPFNIDIGDGQGSKPFSVENAIRSNGFNNFDFQEQNRGEALFAAIFD